MLELEAGVIRFAAEGRGTQRAAGRRPPGRSPVEILGTAPTETATLNAGQQAAIRHALKSKDRVTLIAGRAGVGKTTALEGLAAELRASGVPVRAVAPTSKAAEELRGVDPESDTLARFLLDDKMQESARGGWVVLDELSLAGVRDVAKLVKALDRVDARLLGVGRPDAAPRGRRGDAVQPVDQILGRQAGGDQRGDAPAGRLQDGERAPGAARHRRGARHARPHGARPRVRRPPRGSR